MELKFFLTCSIFYIFNDDPIVQQQCIDQVKAFIESVG